MAATKKKAPATKKPKEEAKKPAAKKAAPAARSAPAGGKKAPAKKKAAEATSDARRTRGGSAADGQRDGSDGPSTDAELATGSVQPGDIEDAEILAETPAELEAPPVQLSDEEKELQSLYGDDLNAPAVWRRRQPQRMRNRRQQRQRQDRQQGEPAAGAEVATQGFHGARV